MRRGGMSRRRRPAMSVLDMVEKQADELLKNLSAPRPSRLSLRSSQQPVGSQSVQPAQPVPAGQADGQPKATGAVEEVDVISLLSEESEDRPILPVGGVRALPPVALDAVLAEDSDSSTDASMDTTADSDDSTADSDDSEDSPICFTCHATPATPATPAQPLPVPPAQPPPVPIQPQTAPPVQQSTQCQSPLQSQRSSESTSSTEEDSPICFTCHATPASPIQPPPAPPVQSPPVPIQPPPVQQSPQRQSPQRQPPRQSQQPSESTSSTEEDEPIALLSTSLKRPLPTLPEPSKSTSSSSLLIPCIPSSLSVVDTTITNMHSNLGDAPTIKPPPLTKEVIDALFPRDDEVLPKRARVTPPTGVCCPLCGRCCGSAELLRDHLNFECRCLPPMVSDEEKEAISRLLDSPESSAVAQPLPGAIPPTAMPSAISAAVPVPTAMPTTTLPTTTPTTHPPTTHPQTVPTTTLPTTAMPTPTTVTTTLPQAEGTSETSLGINSDEIDSLLRMELEATPPQCTICRDTGNDPTNSLLRCAHCGVFVHASCYGLSSTPSGRWQCDVSMARGCEA